ncbi:MAG: recombinase family protein, partial [Pseudomonadota bacterium]
MPRDAIIYARYSDEQQNEQTIDAQISACREYAERFGWRIVDVFQDYSTTGAYFKRRPGIQAFLERAKRGDVDVALCTATDRLSRDGEHAHKILKQLTHNRVELHSSQTGKVETLEFGIRAAIAEDYLKQTAAKTRDGMRYAVTQGKSAGGLSYGYKVKQVYDGNGDRIPGYREIVPEEGAIVVRIFEDYANGRSPQAIATELNKEGIPGPRGAKWRDTAIRGHRTRGTGVLNNELYLGNVIWNRQTFSKDPDTETRKARMNGEEKWTHHQLKELQIVPDDLWNRVKNRQTQVRSSHDAKQSNPLNAMQRPRHLLSRRLECAECGGPYAIMAKDRYGCTNHKKKLGCTNSRSIKRQTLEQRVLKAFPASMFSITDLAALTETVNQRLRSANNSQGQERARLEREISRIDKKIKNTAEAIAEGGGAGLATLTTMLAGFEQQKADLNEELNTISGEVPELQLVSEADVAQTLLAALEAMATVDMSFVEPTYRDQFFTLIQSMVQKVVIAPNPEKGVDLQVHGRLATILATLEAWKEEEARMTKDFQEEFADKCARGEIRTDVQEAVFLERINAELALRADKFGLESKRRSYERLQVSVVAGAGFE